MEHHVISLSDFLACTLCPFFFFGWGEGGKCVMHRSALGAPVGLFYPLDSLPPDLPTKTPAPYAGETRPHRRTDLS